MNKKEWLNQNVMVDEWGRPPSLADVPLTFMTRAETFKKRNMDKEEINRIWNVMKEYGSDKTDFNNLDLGLAFVNQLQPVTYKWDKRSKYLPRDEDGEITDRDITKVTPDGTHKESWLDVGFKAQAVNTLEESSGYKISDETNLTVSLSGDGNHYGLQYEKFIPILVKALQEADDKIDALETRIKTLEDA